MSRHRNVRNLDIDDVMAEDEFDEEEDLDQIEGNADFDMDELSEDDRAAMDEGVAHVYSVIGDDTSISLQTIQDTLWYYYFDKEETVNFLLDMIAKQKSAQVKETKAAAKGGDINRAIKQTRRKHLAALQDNQKANGRPIPLPAQKASAAKSSLGSLHQARTGGSSLSSLRMKMAGQQTSATSRLAQLNRDKKPSEDSNKEYVVAAASATRPSALSSLAQQSKSNTGSALQRLAARHKSEAAGTKEVSGPNNTTSSTSALAKLSQRHKDKPTSSSLSDLAKKSRQPSQQPSGLQALKQKQSNNAKENTSSETQNDTMQFADTANSTAMPDQIHEAGKSENEAVPSQYEESSYLDNPLCASPSSVAQFLFTPLKPKDKLNDVPAHKAIDAAKSLNTTIQNLLPSSKNLTTFRFDSPSPDDIVHAAQSQRKIGLSKSVAASS